MATTVTTYPFPRLMQRSAAFRVKVNGRDVDVLHTNVADFLTFECDGSVEVTVELARPATKACVRPLARAIALQHEPQRLTFALSGPMNVMLDVEGLKPLLLYANPRETHRPAQDDPSILWFKAGQVYEVGELRLTAGQTLYVEGGAVVRGSIRAADANDVRLCGRGVIDGSYYTPGVDARRLVVIEKSRHVCVEDLILIEPTSWMLVLGDCDDVVVRNIKAIGECISSDGIDIVGCRNVLVDGCCLKNNDDCVVVKSFTANDKTISHDWAKDVDNIVVRNCVLMNDQCGNALEIGHELRTPSVRNIRFTDCDVLHAHGGGAVFSVHVGDRATVSDVLFENIRVEHYWDRLVDVRVMKSVFNRDEERGQIRRVTFRNIQMTKLPINFGYDISVIGGWDARHTVEDVLFDGFHVNGQHITNADEIDLHTKHANGIRFQ